MANTLLRTAVAVAGPRRFTMPLAHANAPHPLGPRMKRIMDATQRRHARLSLAGLTAALALALIVLPGMHRVDAGLNGRGLDEMEATGDRGTATALTTAVSVAATGRSEEPRTALGGVHGVVMDETQGLAAGPTPGQSASASDGCRTTLMPRSSSRTSW